MDQETGRLLDEDLKFKAFNDLNIEDSVSYIQLP